MLSRRTLPLGPAPRARLAPLSLSETCLLPPGRSTMTAQEIEYSEKYFDEDFEYR